ncbi:MAG: hypothetical protein RLN89_06435 [Parvibaculum sp.]
MVQVIEFKPRETRIERRTYSKPADVIAMPAHGTRRQSKSKPGKQADLAALRDLTRPHGTE